MKYKDLGRFLDKEEQKKIMGGEEGGGGCSCVMVEPGSCGVRKNGVTIIYGWSHDDVQACANYCTWQTGTPYYWCCANC